MDEKRYHPGSVIQIRIVAKKLLQCHCNIYECIPFGYVRLTETQKVVLKNKSLRAELLLNLKKS
jgi:hypothetical protein